MPLDMIMNSIAEYGLITMFIVIFLEYACLPLPSEIVLTFSGAIAAQGKINFFSILVVSIVAGILGALVCYAIGYIGGSPFIDKLAQKFPKMQKGLDASKEKYEKYATIAVGVGRVIPLCRTYISFIAGIAKQDLKTYMISSAIGITLWNTILIGAGYIFSDNWEQVIQYYEEYKRMLIPAILLVGAAVLALKLVKSKKVSDK